MSQPSAVDRSKPPKKSAQRRGCAPAIARQCSRPDGVSMMASRRNPLPASSASAPAHRTSSAVSTFGSTSAARACGRVRNACRSARPVTDRRLLMRTISRALAAASIEATAASTDSRACALRSGGTASSMSMQTRSAPPTSAGPRLSSARPLTNRTLRQSAGRGPAVSRLSDTDVRVLDDLRPKPHLRLRELSELGRRVGREPGAGARELRLDIG